MADDLFGVLTRFHREVVIPDLDSRIGAVSQELRGEIRALRDEMLSHFDAVYKRFDRLEYSRPLSRDGKHAASPEPNFRERSTI